MAETLTGFGFLEISWFSFSSEHHLHRVSGVQTGTINLWQSRARTWSVLHGLFFLYKGSDPLNSAPNIFTFLAEQLGDSFSVFFFFSRASSTPPSSPTLPSPPKRSHRQDTREQQVLMATTDSICAVLLIV